MALIGDSRHFQLEYFFFCALNGLDRERIPKLDVLCLGQLVIDDNFVLTLAARGFTAEQFGVSRSAWLNPDQRDIHTLTPIGKDDGRICQTQRTGVFDAFHAADVLQRRLSQAAGGSLQINIFLVDQQISIQLFDELLVCVRQTARQGSDEQNQGGDQGDHHAEQ